MTYSGRMTMVRPSGSAPDRKAFLDTTVPCERLLSSQTTRAHVNKRLRSFARRTTCRFVQLEFLIGPYTHLVRLQAKIEQGATDAELLLVIDKYQNLPAFYWQRRMASIWLRAFARYCERSGPMPGSFRAFIRAFVLRAWREAFAGIDEVVDATMCLGDVAEPTCDERTHTIDVAVSRRDLNLRAGDLAAFIRARRTEFARIADTLDASPPAKRDRETNRRVCAIRKVLSGHGSITGGDIRSVGDALIAVECPADHVLLTSNIRHFHPITAAIGKVCEKLPDLSRQ